MVSQGSKYRFWGGSWYIHLILELLLEPLQCHYCTPKTNKIPLFQLFWGIPKWHCQDENSKITFVYHITPPLPPQKNLILSPRRPFFGPQTIFFFKIKPHICEWTFKLFSGPHPTIRVLRQIHIPRPKISTAKRRRNIPQQCVCCTGCLKKVRVCFWNNGAHAQSAVAGTPSYRQSQPDLYLALSC